LVAVKSVTAASVFRIPVTETVGRNLSFDFRLPADQVRRTADVNQTSRTGGITLTLDRVAVTSSETVLFMHGSKDPGSKTDLFQGALWPSDLSVSTGTGQVRARAGDYPLGNFSFQHTSDNQLIMFYPGSLLQSDEQWNVSIQKLTIGNIGSDVIEEHDGPWTFDFTLAPPASDSQPLALP
jgi:hypothetical protein